MAPENGFVKCFLTEDDHGNESGTGLQNSQVVKLRVAATRTNVQLSNARSLASKAFRRALQAADCPATVFAEYAGVTTNRVTQWSDPLHDQTISIHRLLMAARRAHAHYERVGFSVVDTAVLMTVRNCLDIVGAAADMPLGEARSVAEELCTLHAELGDVSREYAKALADDGRVDSSEALTMLTEVREVKSQAAKLEMALERLMAEENR